MPIIILYFLLNNLNFTQIGILAGVIAIVTLVTEIPGGIFADLYGKKVSLILHALFGMVTTILYFFGDSFYWFLAASFTYGLAGAFISGTRNAFLYDTLKELKRTSEFKKFNGKVLLYSHVTNAFVLLLIPVIYTFNPKVPFLIGTSFFVTALIIASFFVEPPIKKKSERKLRTFSSAFFESLREIKLSKSLLIAIVLSVVTASFVSMSNEFYQPLLQISGLEVIYFGVIYALMRGVMGVGGVITHRLEKYFTLQSLLLMGIFGIAVSYLGFSVGAGVIIVGSVLVLKLFEGLNRVVLEDEINKNIVSNNRTTILSISSLLKSLLTAGLVLFAGIIADFVGVQGMFVYILGLFAVVTITLIVAIKK